MKKEIFNDLERLETREDFSNFITQLSSDLETNCDDWENQDLPSFLEAMAAWVDDMDGFYKNSGENIPQNIPWKVFAKILYAAKMYE